MTQGHCILLLKLQDHYETRNYGAQVPDDLTELHQSFQEGMAHDHSYIKSTPKIKTSQKDELKAESYSDLDVSGIDYMIEDETYQIQIDQNEADQEEEDNSTMEDEIINDVKSDPNYNPCDLSFDEVAQEEQSDTSSSKMSDSIKSGKFIVFEDNLLNLVNQVMCLKYNPPSPMDCVETKEIGSLIKITAYCINGHQVLSWQSQPTHGQMPLGNLLLSAATLCSDLTYDKVSNMCNLINIRIPSKTTYCTYQNEHIIPEINNAWKTENQAVIQEVISRGGKVALAGDGR